MTTITTARAWVKVLDDISVDRVSKLTETANGWVAKVGKPGAALFRIAGADESSQQAITGVRSIRTSTGGGPEEIAWTAQGGEFVSPEFGHSYNFRIEVDTSTQAKPVPRGGGHFRVVEEGGGGVE